MRILRHMEDLPDAGPLVLGMGFFDGFHRGHQAVLAEVRRQADEAGALAGVLTFFPHPAALLFPQRTVELLQTEEEKEAMMAAMGMDIALIIRPTAAFLAEGPEDFLHSLGRCPNLRGLVCGENFTYGAGAAGRPEDMARHFAATGTAVTIVPLLSMDGRVISSTAIRRLVQSGDMRGAAECLGRYYSLSGGVAEGFKRGTNETGYPTANLSIGKERILPADGVYASFAEVCGTRHFAVTNVGTNPTFGNEHRTVETFLLDFSGDLYGKPFRIEFVERLRGEIRFSSTEALARQIGEDIRRVEHLLRAEAENGGL